MTVLQIQDVPVKTLPPHHLIVNSVYDAVMTHIVSPSDIWCQVQPEQLEQLMEQLQGAISASWSLDLLHSITLSVLYEFCWKAGKQPNVLFVCVCMCAVWCEETKAAGDVVPELVEGDACCARSTSNNVWYRAKVCII